MNMNQMAKRIAKKEKGTKQVSIAQIKEIMRHIATLLSKNKKAAKNFEKYSKKCGCKGT